MKKNRLNFPFLLQSNLKKITNRKYPSGTIMNSNYDSKYKKLPENIYFLGVPNILLAWTRPWQAVSRSNQHNTIVGGTIIIHLQASSRFSLLFKGAMYLMCANWSSDDSFVYRNFFLLYCPPLHHYTVFPWLAHYA